MSHVITWLWSDCSKRFSNLTIFWLIKALVVMEYHVGVCNKLFKVSLVMKMTRHYTEQSKDYVCDASCLVNLLVGKDRNEAKEGLKNKVDEIF